jgi:hypothetical protein
MGCKNKRNAWKFWACKKGERRKRGKRRKMAGWLDVARRLLLLPLLLPLLFAISRCSPSTIEIAPFLMRVIE